MESEEERRGMITEIAEYSPAPMITSTSLATASVPNAALSNWVAIEKNKTIPTYKQHEYNKSNHRYSSINMDGLMARFDYR